MTLNLRDIKSTTKINGDIRAKSSSLSKEGSKPRYPVDIHQ